MNGETTRVISAALLVYLAGVFLFALFPTADVDWSEAVAMALCALASLGLLANIVPGVTLPGQGYAYLITGYAGFTAMMLYLTDTDDPQSRRIAISLILASGWIGAYGAYLVRRKSRDHHE